MGWTEWAVGEVDWLIDGVDGIGGWKGRGSKFGLGKEAWGCNSLENGSRIMVCNSQQMLALAYPGGQSVCLTQ